MSLNDNLEIKQLPDHVEFSIEVKNGNQILKPSTFYPFGKNEEPDLVYNLDIGQLFTHVAVSSEPILEVRWYIEDINYTVKGFEMTKAIGYPIRLTAEDLQNNPIIFSWWKPGTYNVFADIRTSYGWSSATNQFIVSSPIVRDFTAVTGIVGVNMYNGTEMLRFAWSMENFNKDGIFMQAIVANNGNAEGTIAAIQIARNQRFLEYKDGEKFKWSTNGRNVLDIGMTNTIFYQDHSVNLPNDGTNEYYTANDGPGGGLDSDIIISRQFGDYSNPPNVIPETYWMYLMYRSNLPNSIWVPIKTLIWGWAGSTRFITDTGWSAAYGISILEPEQIDPVDFPIWYQNTGDGDWIKDE